MNSYDVTIIGAGPAGLFTAYYILNNTQHLRVLLVDKGLAMDDRHCSGNCATCLHNHKCDILCGVGGAGLFSDGKLILDLHSGGKIDAISNLNENDKSRLTKYILKTLRSFDGDSEFGPDISPEMVQKWKHHFDEYRLAIKHYDVLHMGTANLQHITNNFIAHLKENPRFTLKTNFEVDSIQLHNDTNVICSTDREQIYSNTVVFAVGKTGSNWLEHLFKSYNISFSRTNTYIGVRVETPHKNIQNLFSFSFDPKIWAYVNNRKVKTHCFCRHGEIVCSNYLGVPIIGGHTRFTVQNGIPNEQLPQNSNFNILVSTDAPQDTILSLLNDFKKVNPSGGLVQTLFDFMNNCISSPYNMIDRTRYSKGNIRSMLNKLTSTGDIIAEFILQLSKVIPDLLCKESFLYAPAIEWFMNSVNVDSNMETSQKGWFAIGDGAGLSQGIIHAAATGVIAAHEISSRLEKHTC